MLREGGWMTTKHLNTAPGTPTSAADGIQSLVRAESRDAIAEALVSIALGHPECEAASVVWSTDDAGPVLLSGTPVDADALAFAAAACRGEPAQPSISHRLVAIPLLQDRAALLLRTDDRRSELLTALD